MVDSVRVQVIDSSVKLDDFMKFAQLERELQVRLQDELKIQTARLEALKVITDVIRKRTCGIALGKNEFYMQDEVDNAFIKADEAIAKAEAKQ